VENSGIVTERGEKNKRIQEVAHGGLENDWGFGGLEIFSLGWPRAQAIRENAWEKESTRVKRKS